MNGRLFGIADWQGAIEKVVIDWTDNSGKPTFAVQLRSTGENITDRLSEDDHFLIGARVATAWRERQAREAAREAKA